MASSGNSRLSREQRKQLKQLGWTGLNRKKARRPGNLSKDEIIFIEEEKADLLPLVKLEERE